MGETDRAQRADHARPTPLTQVARARASGGNSNLIHDEWGVETVVTGGGDDLLFGYAGGLRDPDTNLVRFGARDYDPHSGRWTAKDAIEYFGIDPQRYQYCFSRPTDLIDPTGNYPGKNFGDPCCEDPMDEAYQQEHKVCQDECVSDPQACKEKKKCVEACWYPYKEKMETCIAGLIITALTGAKPRTFFLVNSSCLLLAANSLDNCLDRCGE